jgi:bifunctional non-homologous end joining protein LigD
LSAAGHPYRANAGTVGALLLGVPSPAGLRYIGNVGTGLTDAVLADLLHQLTELNRPSSPFEPMPNEFARHARWVAAEIMGEVEYRSMSRDGRLRHPSWRGGRDDKSAVGPTTELARP